MPFSERGVGDSDSDEQRDLLLEMQADGVVTQFLCLDGHFVEAEPRVNGMEGGDEQKPKGWELDQSDAESRRSALCSCKQHKFNPEETKGKPPRPAMHILESVV